MKLKVSEIATIKVFIDNLSLSIHNLKTMMMPINYNDLLEQALCKLRALEINSALNLFYQLLDEHPYDLELIRRIYPIEKRRKSIPDKAGLKKITDHIFSLDSKSKEFHELIISTWLDNKKMLDENKSTIELNNDSHKKIYNLFFHLGQTGYTKDCNLFKQYIKRNLSENKKTPISLFYYCEQLVKQKKILLAKEELEYLLIYYAEAKTTIPAENLLKNVKSQLLSA